MPASSATATTFRSGIGVSVSWPQQVTSCGAGWTGALRSWRTSSTPCASNATSLPSAWILRSACSHKKGAWSRGARTRLPGCRVRDRESMKIGVPKEVAANERRVALTPEVAGRLKKGGFEIVVERGAGSAAFFPDSAYTAAGATLVDRAVTLGEVDVTLPVQAPAAADVARYPGGGAGVAAFQPAADPALVRQLAQRKITTFSLVLLPRITRAQGMDVLSSQATVAGYKAVLIAAPATGRLLPMLVTPAGTLPAARVLGLGAGGAGLQAIATARRLGAIVSAFDVRPAVKEQVQSLGATFLEMAIEEHAETAGGDAKELSADTHQKELAFLAKAVKDADIVITTAAIPGKKAPILITAAAVEGMKPGAVIVDLAAEHLGDPQDEVGGGGPDRQLAGELYPDHFGDQHEVGLAQHDRLRLDAPDAPAEHTEPVDHRRVGIGPHQGVGVGGGLAEPGPELHHRRQVLEIHLVHDAGAGRDDAEVPERPLGELEELIALGIAVKFQRDVAAERVRGPVVIHLHRVVDHQVAGHHRIDAARGAPPPGPGIPHRGQIHHARHAGEVLEDDAGGQERNLAAGGRGRAPAGERGDVLRGHEAAPRVAQGVFEQHPDRKRQAVESPDT